VTADALLVERFGQSIAVGNFGMAAMERCIEAGDLRKPRLPRPERANGAEIVRLVEWSERRESLKPLDHGVVDEDRLAVVRTAMHHTMADSNRQAAYLGAQEFHDLGQRRRHVANISPGPGLVDQRL